MAMVPVLCLLLMGSSASLVLAFQHKIKACVLDFPGSDGDDMYTIIGDVLRETTLTARQRAVCTMTFSSLTFNTSTGDSVYRSLNAARDSFTDRRVAAAIGPFIDVFASTDYVILHQFHLLTSAAGQNAGLMDRTKVVSILPEPRSMARAIADVIARLQWDNVAFLSQEDFSPVLELGLNNIEVWPIRLPTAISAHTDLELKRNLIQLRESEKKKFILHSSKRDIVYHVMMAAKHLHLLHHGIDWFVSYPDFEDLAENEEWPGSLYGLRLLRKEMLPANITDFLDRNLSRLDLGLALDVVGLLQHVQLMRSEGCFSRPRNADQYVTADDFKLYLKDKTTTYTGALGQYVWDDDGNARTNYTMDILAYKTGQQSMMGVVEFVNGTPIVSLHGEPSISPLPDYIFSKDDEIVIVTTQLEPFIMKDEDGQFTGFSYDLLTALADKLHFRFRLVDVTHLEHPDDPRGAMVQELIKGTASMAVGALEVTAEREAEISFSYTIMSTRASLLIRKGKSTHDFFQFVNPFTVELWLVILAFIAVAAMALFLISRYDPAQANEQRFDLKESAWYALNILLQGTTDYSPQTTSMRAIIAFFWFAVIIIEAAYTANLAAYLTLQQMDTRIKTVFQLSQQAQTKYGVRNNSNIMKFLRDQKEDPFERMWAFIKINEESALLPSNVSLIISKVKSGHFIFIDDGVINEYYATQFCGIEAVDQNFGAKDFSFGFPRGAPYRDDINRALLQLKEEGKLDELKRKWWLEGMNCTADDDTRSVSDQTTAELDITNMVGVFIVLAATVVLGCFIDIGERVYRSRKVKEEKTPPAPDDNVIQNQYTAEYN